MSYLWDEQLHLFRRTDPADFFYSDGNEVEDRLFDVVTTANDRSTFSQELAAAISDWPSEYHLSRARHCLVRPLGINAGDRVLELGCGCGAITRFLGELGASVVAVEGSLARARVAAQRCRGLGNVRVFVDDLLHFETGEHFDWIFLVGVLEYAAVFSREAEPFQDYLRSVVRFLAPGGKVVVAIENKLGLKYFNGCAEDHLGVPFFGIQNLYEARTPRTFGKQELNAQLDAAGLPYKRFYYPFPDYKLPSVVLSESSLSDPEFDPVDLLARSHARDYAGSPYRSFDEALAFSSLGNNGLIADLSNSFLVVAAQEADPSPSEGGLAVAFSVNRAPQYATQTRFARANSGIRVMKEALVAGAESLPIKVGPITINNRFADADYKPGRQVLWAVLAARARDGGLTTIIEALRPWMEFLLQHARAPTAAISSSTGRMPATLNSYVLPGDFLDCTPFNLLNNGHGLFFIDAEWQCDGSVSLGWVVTRSIVWSLLVGMPIANCTQSLIEVLQTLCAIFGLSLSASDIEGWLAQEATFQGAVLGHSVEALKAKPNFSGMTPFRREVVNLQDVVFEQDRYISTLNDGLRDRDDQIAALNHAAAEQGERTRVLHADISNLQFAVSKREGEVAALRGVLTERDGKFTELNQLLIRTRDESEQATSQLQTELAQSLAHAGQLQEDLTSSRRELELLQSTFTWRATEALRSASANYPRARRLVSRSLHFLWWTFTLQLPSRLRARRRLFGSRRLILASPLFDAEWYLAHYPDVAAAGWDPALHYALVGGVERRNPGPNFDAGWYLDHSTDVAAAGVNPLLHFLQIGASEGRETRTVVEPNIVPADSSSAASENYLEWVERYDTINESDAIAIRRHIAALPDSPLVSIVLPVCDPSPVLLRHTLDSVLAQLYPRWELCISDDASSDPDVRTILQEYAMRDRRIRFIVRPQRGGTSAAGNSALDLVSGKFVALMDQEDQLAAHALYMVAVELNRDPYLDIIYSDEDRLDAEGRRQYPHFKANWDEVLYYSQDTINHLGVYRTSLIRKAGGFREGFEASADYDLTLRVLCWTQADRIGHIPFILYHGRSMRDPDNALRSRHRALADCFASRHKFVQVKSGNAHLTTRLLHRLPEPLPRVSLIVPTRDKAALLRNCIDGLLHKTNYENVEIIVVDNGSSEAATLEYLSSLREERRIRVLRIDGAFNYSALNNRAVDLAEGELIGLINNDIEIIDPGWLEEMVSHAVQPGVGAVGAKLYFRDDTIQHAGVVLGMIEVAGHNDRRTSRSDPGYCGRLQNVRNVSCVTAACMIVPKPVFIQVGGFDDVNLKVAYNDVDLCLKIREAGYRIVWTPYAELYHLESISRGYDNEPQYIERARQEVNYMKQRWGAALVADPFYSPNLSLVEEKVGFAFPPRVLRPWSRWQSAGSVASNSEISGDRQTDLELSKVFSYISKPMEAASLPKSVAIGVSSIGNFFMTEIGRMLEDAFRELSVPARLFTESEAATVSGDESVVVVAPHEFFVLGNGPEAFEILKRVATLVMVNTEQRQTPWFAVAEPYLRSACAVLDINYQSAQQLTRWGYRAFALPLGYSDYVARTFDGRVLPDHELFKHMPPAIRSNLPSSYADRPIDVLFVGTSSVRRQEFFARTAGFFSGISTFIYMPDGDSPFQKDETRTIDFSSFIGLVRRSKILLNVHRDNIPYFESQRITTLGLMQKTLVISEQCQRSPWVESNVDYLAGPLEGLPALCEFSLANTRFAEEMTERAFQKLRAGYPMSQIVGKCWTALLKDTDTKIC